ncbi:MAG: T9SS type A sorting domain-containing protein [Hymenobacter sp.]|nr:MAG: T9SS type A sorting domain-containing protein [Hymenobacter sp.]
MKKLTPFALVALLNSLATLPAAHAQTACSQTSTTGYRADTGTGNVEKRTATETELATSFTFSNYATVAAGSTATTGTVNDVFQLTNLYGAQVDGRALIWRQNNTGTPLPSNTPNTTVNTATPFRSQVLLTFSREVSNLTLVFQDIDKGQLTADASNGGSDYTDEVDFFPRNAAGQPTDISSSGSIQGGFGPTASNSTSATCAYLPAFALDGHMQVGLRGTALNGTLSSPNRTGNVTIRFTNPVKTLLLTYRNLNTDNTSQLRLQTIGIEQISWCAQADLTTTIASAAPPAAGGTGHFNVSFSNVGDLTTSPVTAQVQLPKDMRNVTATNGGTYDAGTGIVTYSATSAAPIATYQGALSSVVSYTAPAAGTVVTATSTVSTATSEGLNPNTNTAMASTTMVAPLPVSLTAFAARAAGPDAQLSWTTAFEKNNDYFAIERSADGVAFAQVGTVRGHGSAATASTYAYTDAGIAQRTTGTVYYRLRQVDVDGTATYSPVQALVLGNATAAGMHIYPNPATASATTVMLDLLALPQGTYQASLLNTLGAPVATAAVEGGQARAMALPATLPAGTYLVLVQGNGLCLLQRLARQ